MSDADVKPGSGGSMNLLTLAVPDFMAHKPNVWFAIFEIELENRGISADQAKYNQLVPRLPQQVVTLVEDVLLHPPKDGKYEAMKQLILKESQPSARARLEQLFHSTKLGDRKPSVLLRDIQQIAGPSYMSEEALKELWLSRLPDPLPLMLVAYPNRSLKELAITADAAFERIPQHMKASSSIFATLADKDLNAKAPAQADPRDEEIAALRRELATVQLERQGLLRPHADHEIAAVRHGAYQPRPPPYRSRSPRRRSPSPPRSRTRSANLMDDLCWYHRQYGDNARRCRSPCAKRGVVAQGN
ncbi:unnamed protein product [Dicrocoelium dendriticum]|nr:unnamed protein product [Dicrocoelium dendriticum]